MLPYAAYTTYYSTRTIWWWTHGSTSRIDATNTSRFPLRPETIVTLNDTYASSAYVCTCVCTLNYARDEPCTLKMIPRNRVAIRFIRSQPRDQINDVISPSELIVNLWPFRTISEFNNFRRGARRCENVVARVQLHQVAGIKWAATQSEITNEFPRLYSLFTIFIFHFESLSFVIAVNLRGFPRAHVVRTI